MGGGEGMAVRRIKLVVAYDGTNYCGWQVQPNGISIQAVLQKHIEALTGEKIMLTGASGPIPGSMPWDRWPYLIRKSPGRRNVLFLP